MKKQAVLVCVCAVCESSDSRPPAVLHCLIWDAFKKWEGLAAFLSNFYQWSTISVDSVSK